MNTSTTSTYLILGATGSIGFAFTQELLSRQIPVTILVRNAQKAAKLFPIVPQLEIIQGDVQDRELLMNIAADKKVIFHGINYPYHQWEQNMENATRNIIEAATVSKATILFPGNVYNFGNSQKPILENSEPNPCSKKGAIRIKLEKMLQEAANEGKCQVINVRLPDFWGPNVTNAGIAPIFENALKKKAMPSLIRNDIPHQLVYTKDAAKIIYQLCQLKELQKYEVFNYGGEVFPSVRHWQALIAKEAKSPLKTRVYSKTFVKVMGVFIPVLREVKEMLYLYESTVVLNDDKVRKLFPEFRETPVQVAAKETLDWFQKNAVK